MVLGLVSKVWLPVRADHLFSQGKQHKYHSTQNKKTEILWTSFWMNAHFTVVIEDIDLYTLLTLLP